MIAPGTPEQNQRYRDGICVDCGEVPHSAGRPRCGECHVAHVVMYEPGTSTTKEAR